MAANLRTYVAVGHRRGRTSVGSLYGLERDGSFSLDRARRAVLRLSPQLGQLHSGHDSNSWCGGTAIGGANLAIASDVPIGAGLSSSAALEISVGFALAEMAGSKISRLDLALAAQKAEHVFVGTNSGLMDQLTATFAEKNHAMLIDCRSDQDHADPHESADDCGSDLRYESETCAGEFGLQRTAPGM